MREAVRKKLAKAAKKGKRIVIASFAGAIALSSNISYAQEIGIEDVFDEHYYADQYSDLKNVYGYAKALLLDHFMKFGISEGRQMNELIDIIEYREKYPDLQEAFGDDWDAYIAHYFSYGAFEHRDNGTDFDPVDYLNRYSDLQAVLGTDIMAAYKHYKEFGQQEGREGRSEATVKAEKEAAARAQEKKQHQRLKKIRGTAALQSRIKEALRFRAWKL